MGKGWGGGGGGERGVWGGGYGKPHTWTWVCRAGEMGVFGWGCVGVDGVHSYGPRPLKPTGGDMAIS